MLKCVNGHEVRTSLKCQQCGGAIPYGLSFGELQDLPDVPVSFEEVATLSLGYPPAEEEGVYAAEARIGSAPMTSHAFEAPKIEGGTWLDYSSKYAAGIESWLRLLEFKRSKFRLAFVDSTNPLAVAVVKSMPDPESTMLVASVPGRSSTPVSQNTSFVALQLARRRGMHPILATEGYIDQLAAFVEGEGISTGPKAYDRVMQYLVTFASDLSDLVQKDKRLGVDTHFFSVLFSASSKVFRTVDDALSVEFGQGSLEALSDRCITLHLLASAATEAQRGIGAAFSRFCSRETQGLMNAELRFREKTTEYDLYDLLMLHGAVEPAIYDELKKGYEVVASTARDLSLETPG